MCFSCVATGVFSAFPGTASCVFVQVWRGLSSGPSTPVPVVGPDQPHSAPGLPVLFGPSSHLPLPPALTLHEVRPHLCFLLPFFPAFPEGNETRFKYRWTSYFKLWCRFNRDDKFAEKDSRVSEKVSPLNTNKASVYYCVGRGWSFDAAQQSSQESSSSGTAGPRHSHTQECV